jgi:CRP-like cAMP-binding protein
MENQDLTPTLLKRFSPLDGLKRNNLAALAAKSSLKDLPAGRILFRQGEQDKRTYYLVSGEIELCAGEKVLARVRGGSDEARTPIAPMQPRRFTARSATDVRYIVIDSDMLDVLLTWDQTGTYEVNELTLDTAPNSDDWMTTLFHTRAFHRVPPTNLQAIFMRMERVDLKAGAVVIKQGDEGDYFYAITAGRVVVARETPLNREGIKLAELGPGETFGEEALISEAKRNATITMLTDGTLMRLNKQDFKTLLTEPMLTTVSYPEANKLVDGGARWLDVRLPSEFEAGHLPKAINIPLYFLRLKLKQLDPRLRYVVVCDTGRRSAAGAFILNERGFDAVILREGLTTVPPAAG